MKYPTVHFIGIGGIGMSGIARIYQAMGFSVQGSDTKKNELLTELESQGAKIFIGHDPSYVDGADWVVYSSSIAENHPERREALKKNLRVLHRSQALSTICEGKFTIAVSGTHGKTTTTALVGMVLKEARREPSIVVGGVVNFFGGNACWGKGREIVVEADESDSSFLNLSPHMEVITNIEEEHMDHFKTPERVEAAYRDFVNRLPAQGLLIACAEDEKIRTLAQEKLRKCVLYGFDDELCEIYASDIQECPEGRRGVSFEVWRLKDHLGRVDLGIIGRHNVLNALAAIAVGLELGIDFKSIALALQKYEGAGRRFDVKYEDRQFLIVDDYAHHPTEIRETLSAARALHRKRIVALFQPHRYSRTESLLNLFGPSFQNADKLVVTDIYSAGEASKPGLSGESLSKVIEKAGHPDVTFIKREDVEAYVRGLIQPGDLLIAMGAGDINQVAHRVADFLKQSHNGHGSIFEKIRGKVLQEEPIARHTSLKIGGPAEYWIEPEDEAALKTAIDVCRENGIKVTVLGAGSNVLVADEGVRGAVIYLGSAYFRNLAIVNGRVLARAGVPNSLFIQFALENGFGGCEFLSGIPGSIGGSISMNAGSHNQSVDTYLESVKGIDLAGTAFSLKKSEIPFSYRCSGLTGKIITEGVFALPRTSRAHVQEKLDEYREHRMRTQDLWHASAGCMFKNPKTSNCSSGKLIEDSGLKGFRVGNAQVSEKHANFIINLGGATFKDVCRLINEVKSVVNQKFGVELETEVKILRSDG